MGSEATEGVHGAGGRSARDTSGVASDRDDKAGGRKGSEPLEERGDQHTSGYGGKGGAPISSSDQREPNKPKR
jgi:hypothetical protein